MFKNLLLFFSSFILICSAYSESGKQAKASDPACDNFGPQAPRDIDQKYGTNPQKFGRAPHFKNMNLCNIHFHESAEHKAEAFSTYAGDGKNGQLSGYKCGISRNLSKQELMPPNEKICRWLHPGDTIEVHWVHTSCDITPGKGLISCMSEKCANPTLRVEVQVFTLVNDPAAQSFEELSYGGHKSMGRHQAKNLPYTTGKPVEFLGSTTGPGYSEQTCSPVQVTWSVRPECAKLDINTLGNWCQNNRFEEDRAHGVRKLVANPKLLSEME